MQLCLLLQSKPLCSGLQMLTGVRRNTKSHADCHSAQSHLYRITIAPELPGMQCKPRVRTRLLTALPLLTKWTTASSAALFFSRKLPEQARSLSVNFCKRVSRDPSFVSHLSKHPLCSCTPHQTQNNSGKFIPVKLH